MGVGTRRDGRGEGEGGGGGGEEMWEGVVSLIPHGCIAGIPVRL